MGRVSIHVYFQTFHQNRILISNKFLFNFSTKNIFQIIIITIFFILIKCPTYNHNSIHNEIQNKMCDSLCQQHWTTKRCTNLSTWSFTTGSKFPSTLTNSQKAFSVHKTSLSTSPSVNPEGKCSRPSHPLQWSSTCTTMPVWLGGTGWIIQRGCGVRSTLPHCWHWQHARHRPTHFLLASAVTVCSQPHGAGGGNTEQPP